MKAHRASESRGRPRRGPRGARWQYLVEGGERKGQRTLETMQFKLSEFGEKLKSIRNPINSQWNKDTHIHIVPCYNHTQMTEKHEHSKEEMLCHEQRTLSHPVLYTFNRNLNSQKAMG